MSEYEGKELSERQERHIHIQQEMARLEDTVVSLRVLVDRIKGAPSGVSEQAEAPHLSLSEFLNSGAGMLADINAGLCESIDQIREALF